MLTRWKGCTSWFNGLSSQRLTVARPAARHRFNSPSVALLYPWKQTRQVLQRQHLHYTTSQSTTGARGSSGESKRRDRQQLLVSLRTQHIISKALQVLGLSRETIHYEMNSSGCYLQVLGTSADAPAVITVFTQDQCYLFNCGEGMQRTLQQYKVNQSRLNTVLLTSTAWQNTGGLPGFLLTKAAAADVQNNKIAPGRDPNAVAGRKPDRPTTVVGAALEPFLEATRNFVNPKQLNCIVASVSPELPTVILRANEITLYAIPHPPAAMVAAAAAARGKGAASDGGGGGGAAPTSEAPPAIALERGAGAAKGDPCDDGGCAAACGSSFITSASARPKTSTRTTTTVTTTTAVAAASADTSANAAVDEAAESITGAQKMLEKYSVDDIMVGVLKKRKHEIPAPTKQPLVGNSFKFGTGSRKRPKRYGNYSKPAAAASSAGPQGPYPAQGAARHVDSTEADIRMQTSYIGRIKAPPGKLNIKKAAGVPKKELARFKLGLNYVFQDPSHPRFGQTVRPMDVLGRSEPDYIFAVIECPDDAAADVLVESEAFASMQGGGNLKNLESLLLKDAADIQYVHPPSHEAAAIDSAAESVSSAGANSAAAVADEHEPDARLRTMFHTTPHAVVQSKKYQAWMQTFGGDVKHVFINREVCLPRTHYLKSVYMQTLMSTLHSKIFPPLYQYDEAGFAPPALPSSCEPALAMRKFWPFGDRPTDKNQKSKLAELNMMPLNRVDVAAALAAARRHNATVPGLQAIITSLGGGGEGESESGRGGGGAADSAAAAAAAAAAAGAGAGASSISLTASPLDNAEVVFLGTGSSVPGIERNVSGILLNVGINREHVDHNGTPLPEWSMLLDAGEGTYAQMVSAYGPKVDVVLQNLKCVHISHIHADHHLGIVQVLQERNTLLGAEAAARNPLLIIAPRQLERWLADYTTAVSQELHYTIVGHGALYQGNNNCPELLKEAGLVAVESINVAHCKSAVGAIIIHKDGWKLVYSGDTRPCNALVSAGQGATLLIHEATFPDDMMVHAEAKKHSTYSEAMAIGEKMGAQHTILTHFSQRLGYSLPVIDHVKHPNTIVAYDHMHLRFSDLPTAAKLYDALRMFLDKALENAGLDADEGLEAGVGNIFRKKALPDKPGGTSQKAKAKAQRRAMFAAKSGRKVQAEAKWKEKNKKRKADDRDDGVNVGVGDGGGEGGSGGSSSKSAAADETSK